MPTATPILEELVVLSRSLGDPARDLAILGEGNTSAQIDLERFYVKASGKQLGTADADSFVECSLARAMDTLTGPDLTDAQVKQALVQCKVDPTIPLMPS